MVKRIEKDQLRVGMYIESVEGAWLNMPFAGRRFLLKDPTHLEAIKNSNLSGIYINPVKGIDVADTEQRPIKLQQTAARSGTSRNATGRKAAKQEVTTSLTQSKTLLKEIFERVRVDGGVKVENVKPIINDIARTMDSHGDLMISMTRLKSRDETTFLHSIAVAALMIRFGRHLRMSEDTVQLLGMSGLLHDIGKIMVPTEILNKETSLDEREMNTMRLHPVHGHEILTQQGGMPDMVLDVCLNHHERQDGTGYPNGLAARDISMPVRIATICDVYDAITSARPYKKPWTVSEAATWMLERKGIFHRPLLMQFFNGVLTS